MRQRLAHDLNSLVATPATRSRYCASGLRPECGPSTQLSVNPCLQVDIPFFSGPPAPRWVLDQVIPCQSHYSLSLSILFRLKFWPCFGWLPYARLPSFFLSLLMLAPRVMSTRGGVWKPKLLATFTRSSPWTSKTDLRLWDAYA